MSRPILQGLLREQLGFRGLIVSDDLEMKAIADRYSPPDAAVAAIAAGCDAVLMCGGIRPGDFFDLAQVERGEDGLNLLAQGSLGAHGDDLVLILEVLRPPTA